MKTIFHMAERFGTFLSDGDVANAFRFTEVEPALAQGHEVVFDFGGVTNMTSSFCNALVASVVAHHVEDFATRIKFSNCDPLVKQFITGAVALGRQEAKEFA